MSTVLKAIAEALLRLFKAHDRRSAQRAEKAIVDGDAETVNRDFKDLLRVLVLLTVPMLAGGCTSYCVIDSAHEMVPIVHKGHAGWFVPNAQMLQIRQALSRAKGGDK